MDLDSDSADHQANAPQVGLSLPPQLPFGLSRGACIFLALLACFFIWACGSCLWDLSRASWPSTSGRITDVSESPAPKRTAPHVQASYEYSVGGQNYTGITYYAPGPQQPDVQSLRQQRSTTVYYNSFFPAISTIAPDSQSRDYIVYMVFAVLAAIATFFVRPGLNKGKEMRSELPPFLDCLADLVESGDSISAAIEKAANTCTFSCPTLCPEVAKAVETFKLTGSPLHKSLAEIGSAYHVDDLNNFAAVLAAANITGGSIAFQLRQQSDALKYTLKSEQLAATNVARNFGGGQLDYTSGKPLSRRRPMSPTEIADTLNKDQKSQ